MTKPWIFSARNAALAAVLAGTALAAQARVSWSFDINLGLPIYPAYPLHPTMGAVAVALPGSAVSVHFGGVHYRHHRGAWYRPWGPRWVVVAPPVGIVLPITAAPAEAAEPPAPASSVAPAAPSRPAPVVYPRNGQDAQQTESDRQACDRWATTQPEALADAATFMRAVEACMDARGYTMK